MRRKGMLNEKLSYYVIWVAAGVLTLSTVLLMLKVISFFVFCDIFITVHIVYLIVFLCWVWQEF